jgi:hypothetical protein
MTDWKKWHCLIFLIVWLSPVAFGHQPVIVKNESSKEKPVLVEKPEISFAYYGELAGRPHYYRIEAAKPFHFYVNILVPDYFPKSEPIPHHDVSFDILRDDIVLLTRTGSTFDWTRFYEKYGRDYYYMGPAYEAEFGAGTYFIRVYNEKNSGRYALAIGKKERFTPWGLVGALLKARSLDGWFFKPPADCQGSCMPNKEKGRGSARKPVED